MNRKQRRAGAAAPASPRLQQLFVLGAAHHQAGRMAQAASCFHQATLLYPDHADAWANHGLVLLALGQAEQAAACARQALALQPRHAEACNTLGNALRRLGQDAAAMAQYRRAILLEPGHADAHNNLGVALRQAGQRGAAIASYRRALSLRPDHAEARNNLGNALREDGRLEEAVASFRETLRLRPGYAEAHANLGLALEEQRELPAATASLREAIRLSPDDANAHYSLSLALLAQGQMAEGWREYEWRWQVPHIAPQRRDFPVPQWRGEAAAGRSLLIHAEQGFGDVLQFCRYAPLAAARGLRVGLEVPAPLLRLLQSLVPAGVAAVVARGAPLPAFDLHCPLLSLPLAFGTGLDSIPPPSPALSAEPERVAFWARRLAATAPAGPHIGLVWAGRATNPRDRQRSLPVEHIQPLLALPGLHWVSLQKGVAERPHGLTDWTAELEDFAETAALVANLDLVVAVDTAVAHLAASLGRPVWMLDRFNPDWRWLDGRRDSPWYPSLTIFRQPRPGDWPAVLAAVAAELSALAPPAATAA